MIQKVPSYFNEDNTKPGSPTASVFQTGTTSDSCQEADTKLLSAWLPMPTAPLLQSRRQYAQSSCDFVPARRLVRLLYLSSCFVLLASAGTCMLQYVQHHDSCPAHVVQLSPMLAPHMLPRWLLTSATPLSWRCRAPSRSTCTLQ